MSQSDLPIFSLLQASLAGREGRQPALRANQRLRLGGERMRPTCTKTPHCPQVRPLGLPTRSCRSDQSRFHPSLQAKIGHRKVLCGGNRLQVSAVGVLRWTAGSESPPLRHPTPVCKPGGRMTCVCCQDVVLTDRGRGRILLVLALAAHLLKQRSVAPPDFSEESRPDASTQSRFRPRFPTRSRALVVSDSD